MPKDIKEVIPNKKEIFDRLVILEEKVKVLEEKKSEVIVHADSDIAQPIVELPTTPTETILPVPTEYRQVVNEILNDKFGIKIEYLTEGFAFSVIVPADYSTLKPEELKVVGGVDIRTKVISYALGVNGVKEWVNRVYNSFPMEIKTKIKV